MRRRNNTPGFRHDPSLQVSLYISNKYNNKLKVYTTFPWWWPRAGAVRQHSPLCKTPPSHGGHIHLYSFLWERERHAKCQWQICLDAIISVWIPQRGPNWSWDVDAFSPRDNVVFSTSKNPFQGTHFPQFSHEANTFRPKNSFPRSWILNECLSYSEIYIGTRANSAIMLQSKLEAN